MKLGWKKKLFVIAGILLSTIVIIFVVLILTMDKPPIAEFDSCQTILGKAKRVNADVYSPEYYRNAEKKYQAALIEWKIQNEKVFFARDFSKAKELILSAIIKAEEANSSSGTNKNSLKMKYLKEIELLKRKLDNYHDVFIHLPLKESVRKNYEFGKLSLEQGLNAFGKGDIMLATKRLNEGKMRISIADKDVNALLKEYFNDYSKWQNQFAATIRLSAQNNNYAFIVDKIKHKGYLYYNGKLSREYDVEFGQNWIGDKHYSGDKATPEGMYKIIKKKANGNSGYHKALLINYPNEQDYAVFNNRKRQGQISKNSHIGGLIEIHGNGGKGDDWTAGCVALTDKDIDELFSRVSVGTPITIVGSMMSLSELLN
ncbi:MAG TPA: L,D-transpeptidase [Prolixibacteraceae bacterium]|nr:L,D-transpeptidase [Prolixibacteraceae bacterium]